MNTPPKVFISYSHDSDDHKEWVVYLASQLRLNGVDAIVDQWDLRPGDDMASFMEEGVRESDKVLIICSEKYLSKANLGSGGVGYEKMIVNSELVKSLDSNKFIPIVRNNTVEKNIPTFLGPRIYIDFESDDLFPDKLKVLLAEIHNLTIVKPPLYRIKSGEINKDNLSHLKYDIQWMFPPKVTQLTFSPDSLKLAGRSANVTVERYLAGRRDKVFDSDFSCMDYSKDGETLVTAGNTLFFWGTTNWKKQREIKSKYSAVKYSSDGNILALSNSTLELIHLKKGKSIQCVHSAPYFPRGHKDLCFSSDGNIFAAVGETRGLIQVWDTNSGKEFARFCETDDVAVACLEFLPASHTLLSVYSLISVAIAWDLVTGDSKGIELGRPRPTIHSMAISPQGDIIAFGGTHYVNKKERAIVVFVDAKTFSKIHEIDLERKACTDVAFSPNGKFFATACWDGTVRVWKIGSK